LQLIAEGQANQGSSRRLLTEYDSGYKEFSRGISLRKLNANQSSSGNWMANVTIQSGCAKTSIKISGFMENPSAQCGGEIRQEIAMVDNHKPS